MPHYIIKNKITFLEKLMLSIFPKRNSKQKSRDELSMNRNNKEDIPKLSREAIHKVIMALIAIVIAYSLKDVLNKNIIF